MILRPRRLVITALIVAFTVSCFLVRGGMEYGGFLGLGLFLFMPFNLHRVLAKAVDNNQIFTDPKTVEFGPTQLVVTGPNWKSEMPWTRFKGFSEDAIYFYLDLSDNGLASVLPKSAFSFEQQERFRQYAKNVR
jgi:hypothetical protein